VFAGTITGIQNNDTITASYSTNATPLSPVGSYLITPTASGVNLANYAVTYVNGQLSVTAAPLTVTAQSATRVYGSANPMFTGTVTGIQNNDAITASYSSTATTSSPVGSYVITPTVSGANVANYAVTYVNGQLSVTAAPLTVTAQSATRVYGSANPVFAGTVTGIQNNDAITASYSTTATTSSPVGSYVITPTVSGVNLANYAVTSHGGTLTITKGTVAGIVAVSSASPAFLQTNITLQAMVTGTATQATGSVVFSDSGTSTPIGTAQLVNGIAQLQTSALTAGSHQITATYSGDGNYNGATSVAFTQQVVDLTLNLKADATGSTTQSIVPGGTASYAFTLTPEGVSTFPGDVTLSVSGLPAGAHYSFSPATVAKGSGATQVTLTVNVPAATAKIEQPLSRTLAPVMAVLLLLPFSGKLRRRAKRLNRLAAVLLLLAGSSIMLIGLTGCGSQNGFLAQSEKTYNVTVTASTNAVSRSTTMQLIVQ